VSPRRLVVVLMLAAAAFALAATLTGSPVAGWISVALFVGAVAAYVRWRSIRL
jgi:hypothetical protein